MRSRSAPTPGGRWATPRCPVDESLARPLWLTWMKGQAGPRRRPQPFSSVLTAWKVNSEKFGRLLELRFIHILASLCATTTCSVASYASRRREWPVAPVQDRCYAGSCKRTSENNPSTHSGEYAFESAQRSRRWHDAGLRR